MNPRPAQWERPDFVSHCVFCNMPVMCAPVQVRPHSATFPFRESLLERISQNSDSFFPGPSMRGSVFFLTSSFCVPALRLCPIARHHLATLVFHGESGAPSISHSGPGSQMCMDLVRWKTSSLGCLWWSALAATCSREIPMHWTLGFWSFWISLTLFDLFCFTISASLRWWSLVMNPSTQ